jgi:hypothetical protein
MERPLKYDHPISVMACNPVEGWARDISENIAREIMHAKAELTVSTREFVGRVLEHSAAGRAI